MGISKYVYALAQDHSQEKKKKNSLEVALKT